MEKNVGLYYKFTSVEGNKHLEDIFIGSRLFASEREGLNDPMEGIYKVTDENTNDSKLINFTNAIRAVKGEYRICAFSNNKNRLLLWSHYADSCSGIAIGFKLKKVAPHQQFKRKVSYLDNLMRLDLKIRKADGPETVAREILFSKLNDWKYEEEIRVLTKEYYVPIEIKEVILGPNISTENREYVADLVKKYNKKRSAETNERVEVEIITETLYDLENSLKHKVMD